MPLFDFECLKCGDVDEQLILGSDIPRCPKCGSEELRKLLAAPAAPGRSSAKIANARRMAAAAGHLSNYSRTERHGRK